MLAEQLGYVSVRKMKREISVQDMNEWRAFYAWKGRQIDKQ